MGYYVDNNGNKKKVISVNKLVYMGENINLDASPSGTDTSTNILAFTEDKGIYVGTDTGHWYYWNGSQYVDGGTYQATEIANGSVTPEKTSFVKTGNQLFNKENITSGKFVNYLNGNLGTNASYFASNFILISSEETNISILNPSNALQVAFYDENKTYISGSTTSPVSIPSNAKYMRFSQLLSNLDVIMVNYGTSVLPYETYYLVINNLQTDKVFYVGSNRDITTLKEGIETATKHDNAILYVDSGTYNLIDEFGSSYLDQTSSDKGLVLKNGLHIIFSPKSKVIFNYTGSNAYIHKNFSPFNSGVGGFTIENLTLECSNCRYGIHDERGNKNDKYKNVYRNCKISLDNSHNPDWSNPQNIGFGLGGDATIEIENCVFNNWITFHLDNGNRPTSQAIVIVKNSYFKVGAVWIDGNQSITALSRFLVSNNSFSQNMHIGELYDSVELFAFNNEIRS